MRAENGEFGGTSTLGGGFTRVKEIPREHGCDYKLEYSLVVRQRLQTSQWRACLEIISHIYKALHALPPGNMSAGKPLYDALSRELD